MSDKPNKTGKDIREMGFNLDFAPDADVLTEPDNQVIGERSFGSDADTVRKLAKAYLNGLHNKNILGGYKHFPGHGATKGDTHEGYAYTDKTIEELMKSELVPFAHASEDGADFVMVAHISLPGESDDGVPCSLSEDIITGVLRKQLGYDGIVITDALNMGAITGKYSGAEGTLMSVKAGADMILMPANFQQSYNALLEACQSGKITEERIDESVLRILTVKCGMAR